MKKWFYAVLLAVVCFVPTFAEEYPVVPFLTTAQYDKMDKNNQVYILVFTMKYYCPPCRKLEKLLLPHLVASYKGTSNVHIYQMDVRAPGDRQEDADSLVNRFGAVGIPHLLVLHNDTVMFGQLGFSEALMPVLENKIKEVVNKFK